MSAHFLPVIGHSIVHTVFDRLPVQELAANHPYQWSLFILGWAYIKNTPIQFPGIVQPKLHANASHMEIGGIHGKPYKEWAGDKRTPEEAQVDFSYKDKKDTNPSPPRFGGYCHHAAITFPSWHRPYVMLIEQAIGEYAENIAQQIEHSHPGEVGRWVDAAKQLRFPYWDWADPQVDIEGFPALFYTKELIIMGTEQKDMTVLNPLASFTFPYIPGDFFDTPRDGFTAYFSKWKQTYRYVKSIPDPAGSDIKALQAALKEQADSIRTSIGMLFTFADTTTGDPAIIYDEFSNTQNESRQDGDHNNTGSLEGVHNTLHFVLGQNGHMGWTDYAAFDPLFFFHHANIDRLTALWDWCYPEYWMNEGYTVDKQDNNWTIEQGTYAAAYSQKIGQDGEWGFLVPFRHPDGAYWTPKDTRFLTQAADVYPKCDYSYREFLGVKVDKAAGSIKERQEARARIAKYYNVDPQKAASTVHLPSWVHVTVPRLELPFNFQPIENFRIFKVLVRLLEHAVGGSYRFNLCYKQELVGSATVFAREDTSACKACSVRRTAGSIVRGVITIPSRIINDIIVHHSTPEGQNSMNLTVSLIVQAFSATLEDVSGRVLASAQGGTVPSVPARQAAPRKIHPTEVALLSAAVAEHVDDKNQPVYFFDWQRHADIFPNGWKIESQAPAAK